MMKLFNTHNANQWLIVISFVVIVATGLFFCCKFPAMYFINCLAWFVLIWSINEYLNLKNLERR